MRVHVTTDPEGELAHALHEHALDGVALSLGKALPEDPDSVEILVAGRPRAADFDALPALNTFVLPYAGFPKSVMALLRDRPRLRVFNLHHNASLVAEMATALVLAAAKLLIPMDSALRTGDWRPRYAPDPAMVLSQERALILGYGAIGRALAPMLQGLGLEVRAIRRHPQPDTQQVFGLEALADQLGQCRVVVVALPSTEETRGLLDAEMLSRRMRPGSVLVNVGRADIVDEDALYDVLVSGHLRAAALDVWYRYPRSEAERSSLHPANRPFHDLPHVVMSPHRSAHSNQTEQLRARHLTDLLHRLASGSAPEPVHIELGY